MNRLLYRLAMGGEAGLGLEGLRSFLSRAPPLNLTTAISALKRFDSWHLSANISLHSFLARNNLEWLPGLMLSMAGGGVVITNPRAASNTVTQWHEASINLNSTFQVTTDAQGSVKSLLLSFKPNYLTIAFNGKNVKQGESVTVSEGDVLQIRSTYSTPTITTYKAIYHQGKLEFYEQVPEIATKARFTKISPYFASEPIEGSLVFGSKNGTLRDQIAQVLAPYFPENSSRVRSVISRNESLRSRASSYVDSMVRLRSARDRGMEAALVSFSDDSNQPSEVLVMYSKSTGNVTLRMRQDSESSLTQTQVAEIIAWLNQNYRGGYTLSKTTTSNPSTENIDWEALGLQTTTTGHWSKTLQTGEILANQQRLLEQIRSDLLNPNSQINQALRSADRDFVLNHRQEILEQNHFGGELQDRWIDELASAFIRTYSTTNEARVLFENRYIAWELARPMVATRIAETNEWINEANIKVQEVTRKSFENFNFFNPDTVEPIHISNQTPGTIFQNNTFANEWLRMRVLEAYNRRLSPLAISLSDNAVNSLTRLLMIASVQNAIRSWANDDYPPSIEAINQTIGLAKQDLLYPSGFNDASTYLPRLAEVYRDKAFVSAKLHDGGDTIEEASPVTRSTKQSRFHLSVVRPVAVSALVLVMTVSALAGILHTPANGIELISEVYTTTVQVFSEIGNETRINQEQENTTGFRQIAVVAEEQTDDSSTLVDEPSIGGNPQSGERTLTPVEEEEVIENDTETPLAEEEIELESAQTTADQNLENTQATTNTTADAAAEPMVVEVELTAFQKLEEKYGREVVNEIASHLMGRNDYADLNQDALVTQVEIKYQEILQQVGNETENITLEVVRALNMGAQTVRVSDDLIVITTSSRMELPEWIPSYGEGRPESPEINIDGVSFVVPAQTDYMCGVHTKTGVVQYVLNQMDNDRVKVLIDPYVFAGLLSHKYIDERSAFDGRFVQDYLDTNREHLVEKFGYPYGETVAKYASLNAYMQTTGQGMFRKSFINLGVDMRSIELEANTSKELAGKFLDLENTFDKYNIPHAITVALISSSSHSLLYLGSETLNGNTYVRLVDGRATNPDSNPLIWGYYPGIIRHADGVTYLMPEDVFFEKYLGTQLFFSVDSSEAVAQILKGETPIVEVDAEQVTQATTPSENNSPQNDQEALSDSGESVTIVGASQPTQFTANGLRESNNTITFGPQEAPVTRASYGNLPPANNSLNRQFLIAALTPGTPQYETAVNSIVLMMDEELVSTNPENAKRIAEDFIANVQIAFGESIDTYMEVDRKGSLGTTPITFSFVNEKWVAKLDTVAFLQSIVTGSEAIEGIEYINIGLEEVVQAYSYKAFVDLFNQGALEGIATPEQFDAFMTSGNGRALAEFGQHMAIDLALNAKNSSWWGNAYHLIVQDPSNGQRVVSTQSPREAFNELLNLVHAIPNYETLTVEQLLKQISNADTLLQLNTDFNGHYGKNVWDILGLERGGDVVVAPKSSTVAGLGGSLGANGDNQVTPVGSVGVVGGVTSIFSSFSSWLSGLWRRLRGRSTSVSAPEQVPAQPEVVEPAIVATFTTGEDTITIRQGDLVIVTMPTADRRKVAAVEVAAFAQLEAIDLPPNGHVFVLRPGNALLENNRDRYFNTQRLSVTDFNQLRSDVSGADAKMVFASNAQGFRPVEGNQVIEETTTQIEMNDLVTEGTGWGWRTYFNTIGQWTRQHPMLARAGMVIVLAAVQQLLQSLGIFGSEVTYLGLPLMMSGIGNTFTDTQNPEQLNTDLIPLEKESRRQSSAEFLALLQSQLPHVVASLMQKLQLSTHAQLHKGLQEYFSVLTQDEWQQQPKEGMPAKIRSAISELNGNAKINLGQGATITLAQAFADPQAAVIAWRNKKGEVTTLAKTIDTQQVTMVDYAHFVAAMKLLSGGGEWVDRAATLTVKNGKTQLELVLESLSINPQVRGEQAQEQIVHALVSNRQGFKSETIALILGDTYLDPRIEKTIKGQNADPELQGLYEAVANSLDAMGFQIGQFGLGVKQMLAALRPTGSDTFEVYVAQDGEYRQLIIAMDKVGGYFVQIKPINKNTFPESVAKRDGHGVVVGMRTAVPFAQSSDQRTQERAISLEQIRQEAWKQYPYVTNAEIYVHHNGRIEKVNGFETKKLVAGNEKANQLLGEIHIKLTPNELWVEDNGRGMNPEQFAYMMVPSEGSKQSVQLSEGNFAAELDTTYLVADMALSGVTFSRKGRGITTLEMPDSLHPDAVYRYGIHLEGGSAISTNKSWESIIVDRNFTRLVKATISRVLSQPSSELSRTEKLKYVNTLMTASKQLAKDNSEYERFLGELEREVKREMRQFMSQWQQSEPQDFAKHVFLPHEKAFKHLQLPDNTQAVYLDPKLFDWKGVASLLTLGGQVVEAGITVGGGKRVVVMPYSNESMRVLGAYTEDWSERHLDELVPVISTDEFVIVPAIAGFERLVALSRIVERRELTPTEELEWAETRQALLTATAQEVPTSYKKMAIQLETAVLGDNRAEVASSDIDAQAVGEYLQNPPRELTILTPSGLSPPTPLSNSEYVVTKDGKLYRVGGSEISDILISDKFTGITPLVNNYYLIKSATNFLVLTKLVGDHRVVDRNTLKTRNAFGVPEPQEVIISSDHRYVLSNFLTFPT